MKIGCAIKLAKSICVVIFENEYVPEFLYNQRFRHIYFSRMDIFTISFSFVDFLHQKCYNSITNKGG